MAHGQERGAKRGVPWISMTLPGVVRAYGGPIRDRDNEGAALGEGVRGSPAALPQPTTP